MRRTGLLRKDNARAYMRYLKAIKIPFEMVCSNYTVLFKAEGLEKKFVHSMQGNRAFACFAKIKSDVKKKPIPDINKDKLSYFVHNFRQNQFIGDVVNIDLKSAYATVLYKDGYISKATFDYISKGSKQERLVSVGMLASKKQKFLFDNGTIIGDPEEVISEYSNFFFYAVRRTGEIMADLKAICGNDYLFTWVDGIYLRPNEKAVAACEQYIKDIDFKSATDYLRNFTVMVNKKQVTVNFLKEKAGKWHPKPFNLPLMNSEFKRIMIDAILSRKKLK